MKKLLFNPAAMYSLVVAMIFADVLPSYSGSYSGTLSEFTVMDNVPLGQGATIMSLMPKGLQLKRRDGSCKTDWSTVGVTSRDKIHVTELYGAVEDCQEEFYSGCLKDYRSMAPKFRTFILNFFIKLIGFDLIVNSYFGDITRSADPAGNLSWNAFDGVFTHIARYIANNRIPAEQTFEIADGPITPLDAYNTLKNAYDRQNDLLDAEDDSDKAFYVDKPLAKAYERYLQNLGNTTAGVQMLMNGIPTLSFEGIPIFVEPVWARVIRALNGNVQGHAVVLCKRGTFVFGTNKTYGGGANLDQALKVWYSDDDDVWRYKMWLVAGTALLNPENIVVGISF